MVEGLSGVLSAVESAPVEAIFIAPAAGDDVRKRLAAAARPTFELAAGVMERVADTVTPQPVAAIVGFVDRPLDALNSASFVMVCADIRDPGNLGTVVRSAEAAGADGVVCADGSVDIYNPKTVRASAGSLFRVPLVAGGDPVSVVDQFGGWGVTSVGAVAHGGEDPAAVDFTRRIALVFGNEAQGLPAALERVVDALVTIPLQGRAESLNVGMAAAILGFEVARQRRGAVAS